ncbi:uncharacterized protein BX663DRAFT_418300, partial [Cokeromyces recurvatus]|uniref:uncharacterized protein n=1 Tax=Cokeromyces recurvatus TaxID=90255 RepID=UPI00221EFC09
MVWDSYQKEYEKEGKGKKALRTMEDIVQYENVLRKDTIMENAEEMSTNAGVGSQESQNVNILSQDSGQEIQTDTSVPF